MVERPYLHRTGKKRAEWWTAEIEGEHYLVCPCGLAVPMVFACQLPLWCCYDCDRYWSRSVPTKGPLPR